MTRMFCLTLLLCVFLFGCAYVANDPGTPQLDNEILLSLGEDNICTYRDPFYRFTVSFPGEYSFFLFGYDTSYYDDAAPDTPDTSPDRSLNVYLDGGICNSINYIQVVGMHGRAAHNLASDENTMRFENDVGENGILYYKKNEKEFTFEYTIEGGRQFVRGYFELEFYENNEETILDICKSVHDIY